MGRGPYSYRHDPAVPAFPDDRPLVLFDGDCALCSGSARKILTADRAGLFRLAPRQSQLGRALLTHYGVSPDDPATMLLIQDGMARQRSDAVLAIAAQSCLRPIGGRSSVGSRPGSFATACTISWRVAVGGFRARPGAPSLRRVSI